MRFFFGLIFLLFSLSLLSQHIRFYAENLNFEVNENQFVVDGLYYFKNTSGDTIKQIMMYPFPENPVLGEVDFVEGKSVYPEFEHEIIRRSNQKAAHFNLMIFPYDSAIIHIVYKQNVIQNSAEYILTSTRAWKKPLKKAKFTLKLPYDNKVDSLSYHADSLLMDEQYLYYKWYFEDFMPDRNFFVSFSEVE